MLCLVDTKWKRLDPAKPHGNVSQSDVYQAYAYGKEYRSPRVILLYPRWGALPSVQARYAHPRHTGDEPREVWIATVDVSQPLHTSAGVRQLRDDLRELVRVAG